MEFQHELAPISLQILMIELTCLDIVDTDDVIH
jgi:hypothetical protein